MTEHARRRSGGKSWKRYENITSKRRPRLDFSGKGAKIKSMQLDALKKKEQSRMRKTGTVEWEDLDAEIDRYTADLQKRREGVPTAMLVLEQASAEVHNEVQEIIFQGDILICSPEYYAVVEEIKYKHLSPQEKVAFMFDRHELN